MQNKYVGDIGDFGKFALLRNVIGDNFKLGINWYHVPDDEHVGGDITKWLSEDRFIGYDDELRNKLMNLIKPENRNIKELEKAAILNKNVIYYNDILDYDIYDRLMPGNLINKYRKDNHNIWHKKALNTLKDCDIIFLDPDNGINTNKKYLYRKKGSKYISQSELIDYYKDGKSIIFYNHRPMQKENIYIEKFNKIKISHEFINSKWIALTFRPYSLRDFIFVIQPEHYEKLYAKIHSFLDSKWRDHFYQLFEF